MICNWCGEGSGRNRTKDKEGKLYYYYCYKCVGDYMNTLTFKPLKDPFKTMVPEGFFEDIKNDEDY